MTALDDQALRKLHHDLRSPLVVITGFAQLLASDREIDDAQRREYGRVIQAAGEDLQQRVDAALAG